jgi:hypothetical protein
MGGKAFGNPQAQYLLKQSAKHPKVLLLEKVIIDDSFNTLGLGVYFPGLSVNPNVSNK